jgi:hypothetical protein
MSSVGMTYTFNLMWPHRSAIFVARRLQEQPMWRRALSDLLSIFPPWFFIMLAVGLLDALFQFSDYRQWRKEQRESGDVKE